MPFIYYIKPQLLGQGFDITSSAPSIEEGNSVTFNLTTTGVADGTKIYYILSGISENTIDGPMYGNFTVTNNASSLTVQTKKNFTATDETISLMLLSDIISADVTVTDATERSWYVQMVSGSAAGDSTIPAGVAADISGNVYTIGTSNPNNDAYNEVFVTKHDSFGVMQFQSKIGHVNFNDNGVALAVNPITGSIYIAATMYGGNYTDAGLFKLNSSGTLLWQRKLSASTNATDVAFSVAVGPEDECVVCVGPTNSTTNLIKFDSTGNQVWQLTSTTRSFDITIDNSGNIYIVGVNIYATYDTFLAKLNSAGASQWQRRLVSVAGNEVWYGVDVDADGNVYTVGTSSGYPTGQGAGASDVLVAKWNATGDVVQQCNVGTTNADESVAIATDSSGNAYVFGSGTATGGAGVNDGLLFKLTSDFSVAWARAFGTSGSDTPSQQGSMMDVVGNSMYFAMADYRTQPYKSTTIKLPTDGSLTGTRGSYSYNAVTLTRSATAFTQSSLDLAFTPSAAIGVTAYTDQLIGGGTVTSTVTYMD